MHPLCAETPCLNFLFLCSYSYGVVLWEVLTGQQPWAGLHAMQVRLPPPAPLACLHSPTAPRRPIELFHSTPCSSRHPLTPRVCRSSSLRCRWWVQLGSRTSRSRRPPKATPSSLGCACGAWRPTPAPGRSSHRSCRQARSTQPDVPAEQLLCAVLRLCRSAQAACLQACGVQVWALHGVKGHTWRHRPYS